MPLKFGNKKYNRPILYLRNFIVVASDVVPSEMIIDDVVAAEKREITFQELGNESLMAAQSSSGAAIPLSSTPTMLSQSASDASPANTHPSGAISGPGKGPPSKPRLKMIRRSIYDDSGRHLVIYFIFSPDNYLLIVILLQLYLVYVSLQSIPPNVEHGRMPDSIEGERVRIPFTAILNRCIDEYLAICK